MYALYADQHPVCRRWARGSRLGLDVILPQIWSSIYLLGRKQLPGGADVLKGSDVDWSTLHGRLARGRRVFLWAGVTGHLSSDRMDPSMNQHNLQIRKPSVCIGGPWLYNLQRVIVLYIRDGFCVIQASFLYTWPCGTCGCSSCVGSCAVEEAFAVALGPPQTSWGYRCQRKCTPSTDWLAGLCWSHAASVRSSSVLSSGQVYYLRHSLRKQDPRTKWLQELLFINLLNYFL